MQNIELALRSQSLTVPGYCSPPALLQLDTRGRGRGGSQSGHITPGQPRWPSPCNSLHPGPQSCSVPRARSVSPISLVTSCPRSPVPGNYFGHYEQFFRQRLGAGEAERPVYTGQYRRWMSDTDISSDCLDTSTTSGGAISHSQDIRDTDNVFYNSARSG